MIGIDFGTTYSAVATVDAAGRAVTVPNREGEVLTPSAVYFSRDGQAVVGQAAQDLQLDEPERVASVIKRRIGYADYGRPVAGRLFRPETLAAVILRKLASDAEAALGPITGCVITVPAYYDDTRRKATMDAGRIAGLPVVDILDEPSAAALAYLAEQHNPKPETIMVYDLGGGTFDVTFVHVSRQRFQVLAIEGDVRLGGKDWDDRLVELASDRFRTEMGSDPREDAHSLAALQAAAERTKRALSKVDQASLMVNHAGHRRSIPLTRSEFENRSRDLLARTRWTCQQALSAAGLAWEKVDRVLLVGGSTHMPMVRRMLRELTGQEPDSRLAVSEVVARGAAVHAALSAQRQPEHPTPLPASWADVVEVSVNAHSLGVEVRQNGQKLNDKLIPKNTQLPAFAQRTYYTVREDQRRVRVRILQGEAQQAEACIPVGECWIEGLPARLPKGSPVEVSCGVRENGRIVVTARDRRSGLAARAEIHRPGGLTDAQVADEAAWVQSLTIA